MWQSVEVGVDNGAQNETWLRLAKVFKSISAGFQDMATSESYRDVSYKGIRWTAGLGED